MNKQKIISCKDFAEIRKEEIKNEIKTNGYKPTLVVIQIDDNPASNTYIKGKEKDCEAVGIEMTHIKIDSNEVSQKELCHIVSMFGQDSDVDGVIVQLPIPDKYNVKEILRHIPPEKDVDGFRKDSLFNSCTPKGIVDWLKYNNYDFVGKNAVVLGRSEIVGKPLVNMLIDEGATVVCCNSKTGFYSRLKYFEHADLVVSAIGKPKFFNCCDFGTNTKILIDVGINRGNDGKLCGDIDNDSFDKFKPNTYVTPVPNGVGLLTRLTLMDNVLQAYKNKLNK